MMNTVPNLSPADALRAIIARGVAAYQDSLPDYAREAEALVTLPYHALRADELPEPEPNVSAVDEDRQRVLCLNCELADCVGIENEACPIRREQRAVWRRSRRTGGRNR